MYFRKRAAKEISLSEYVLKYEKEYQDKKSEIKKLKHIHRSLGDVLITKEMIEAFLETFDSSKHRYGTICYQQKTIKDTYEISKIFPELTKEALIIIREEYIRDLFEKYSLVEVLSTMIRKDGLVDSTFEEFIKKVEKLAKIEEKEYIGVASQLKIFFGYYPYDFITHFRKFIIEHHISWEKFCDSLPSEDLIYKDMKALRELRISSRECWSCCSPVSFEMLEDYLDGDTELQYFEEQSYYYISTYSGETKTHFTRQEFLESIKQEKIKRLERRK